MQKNLCFLFTLLAILACALSVTGTCTTNIDATRPSPVFALGNENEFTCILDGDIFPLVSSESHEYGIVINGTRSNTTEVYIPAANHSISIAGTFEINIGFVNFVGTNISVLSSETFIYTQCDTVYRAQGHAILNSDVASCNTHCAFNNGTDTCIVFAVTISIPTYVFLPIPVNESFRIAINVTQKEEHSPGIFMTEISTSDRFYKVNLINDRENPSCKTLVPFTYDCHSTFSQSQSRAAPAIEPHTYALTGGELTAVMMAALSAFAIIGFFTALY